MRKLVMAAGLAIIATAALRAQDGTSETSENLVTRNVPVAAFDALSASGAFELRLLQGEKEAVKIEADEALQKYINVHAEGSRLMIDMKGLKNVNLKPKKRTRVYVTFRQLNELDFSTVGSITTDGALRFDNLWLKNASVGKIDLSLSANTLTLDNSSVGLVKLSGKAQNAVVNNKGVGSLDAGDLVVQSMTIENTGVGSATVNAEKDLRVRDSFLGHVKNKGAAPVRKNNKTAS